MMHIRHESDDSWSIEWVYKDAVFGLTVEDNMLQCGWYIAVSSQEHDGLVDSGPLPPYLATAILTSLEANEQLLGTGEQR